MEAGSTSKSRRPEANTGGGNTVLTGKKSGWPSEFGQKSVCGKPETNATSAGQNYALEKTPERKKRKGLNSKLLQKHGGKIWETSGQKATRPQSKEG